MSKIFSIAIDGPAGAGKSTVAKAVAAQLGAVYLDTGAMYRTVGLYMRDKGIEGAEAVAKAAKEPEIEIRFVDGVQRMILGGVDVTEEIRSPEASMLASNVSAVPEVREYLVALQREFAKGNSVVMDGRDIGTVVLKDATLKIFLTASAEERANRRYNQMLEGGKEADYQQILEDIIKRDYNDSHRAASPMRQAEDARLVDTTGMTREQSVEMIVAMAREAIGE